MGDSIENEGLARLIAGVLSQAIEDTSSAKHSEEARAWLEGTGASWAEAVGINREFWLENLPRIGRTRRLKQAIRRQTARDRFAERVQVG